MCSINSGNKGIAHAKIDAISKINNEKNERKNHTHTHTLCSEIKIVPFYTSIKL